MTQLTKVFAKTDEDFIDAEASLFEVTVNVGEGMYDIEDSRTWTTIDSIKVYQKENLVDITKIVEHNFPKFITHLLENIDWEYQEEFESN